MDNHMITSSQVSATREYPLDPHGVGISSSACSSIGSGMTDQEEAQAIALDPVTASLIKKASADYAAVLDEYQKGYKTWDQLASSHDATFAQLTEDVKKAIASSQSDISRIACDDDADHLVDYDAHIKVLLGQAQGILKIPAKNVLLSSMPSTTSSLNLLSDGDFSSTDPAWKITYGIGSMQVGPSKFPDSPIGNLPCATLHTDNKNGVTFGQTISTLPGHWYLVSGYIEGAGNGSPYSGAISINGARSLNGIDFPQNSDEIDEAGLHRRYFWVQASGNSMQVNLSGIEGTSFQHIDVRDITSLGIDPSIEAGQEEAMALAQKICPPIETTGSPEAGWYPQMEKGLANGDNLFDGSISLMKNIDQSALGNAGHPYWYFGKANPADKKIEIVNGQNGARGLILPPGADPTTNGPVPIPAGNYTVSCDIVVSEGAGSIKLTFGGTNLNDETQIAKIEQEFTNLHSGINHIAFSISASAFPNGAFFRPNMTIENKGTSSVSLFNTSLIPGASDADEIYGKINAINPYNLERSWYDPKGCDKTYDFTKGDIDSDWGVALTGNTMFPANPNDVSVTDQGIRLDSHNGQDEGGIQSTQLINPMKDFSISTTFQALSNEKDYEPTFAVWTYGESQRGPDDPLSHRNGAGSDPITEFDCEMGSDPNDGQKPPGDDLMYMRPGSYIGYEMGGHSEILPPNGNWIAMPNFWNTKDVYTLTMSGKWENGSLLLTREITDLNTGIKTVLGDPQNLGPGPFSPMYVKIGLENPSWNAKSHGQGSATIILKGISVSQGPDMPENMARSVPLSEMDYAWFTPGGGGGESYTSFKPRSEYKQPAQVLSSLLAGSVFLSGQKA